MALDSKQFLTKSRFKIASECPRKLWYTAHPETYGNQTLQNDFLRALAEGGHQVGTLAQCYFPGGTLIDSLDAAKALEETNALLAEDSAVIYEAAIHHENFFLRVDVLVKTGAMVQLIEVKAKSFEPGETSFWGKRNPGKLHPKWAPYLDDVAFQTWVTRNAHPDWEVQPYLMLVDKTRAAEFDGLHQLFRIVRDGGRVGIELTDTPSAERLGQHILGMVDVSREVDTIIAGGGRDASRDALNARPMEQRAQDYADLWVSGRRGEARIERKCKSCEFRTDPEMQARGLKSGYEECWTENLGDQFDPLEPHVFDIWNGRKASAWLEGGIHRMEDVPAGDLNDRQQLQVDVTLGRRPEAEVVAPELFALMGDWEFPLHFVDFETTIPAIPFNAGLRPYQSIAFQFSCHHVHEDGTITHDEWLAGDAGVFPNFEFLKALQGSLGDHGTVFRYASHENTILRHLTEQLQMEVRPAPAGMNTAQMMDWVAKLLTDGERAMVDMCDLVKKHYYHRAMGGSNSIKAVLPAVLSTSRRLEELYSRPLAIGTNLSGMTLWQKDPGTGLVVDPYHLLPPLFSDVDPRELTFLSQDDELHEGGAAMTAWARMQFCEMGEAERRAIMDGLLRYCELDTLAMVMIYQHWVG